MELDKFLKRFRPVRCNKAEKSLIDEYISLAPDCLQNLWSNYGFGKYGDALIEIINPNEYNDILWKWLGKKKNNYIPIAMSAFGDLFYYRKLSEAEEDVCMLSPHYRKIKTCVWNLCDFFNEYLTDREIIYEILRYQLFQQAERKLDELIAGEIYYFVPAIIIGGSEEITHLDIGKAKEHFDILFNMGN